MLSAVVVCCKYLLTLLTNLSTEANSVDPDQTAHIGSHLGLHCLNKRLLKYLGRQQKQTTVLVATFVAIGSLRVKFLHYFCFLQ